MLKISPKNMSVSLGSFSSSIRSAQMMGTLEAILVTQTEIPTIIISSSFYSFIWTSFRVIAYLLIGVFLFDLNISEANFIGGAVILLLSIITVSSIGILSASFIMVLKIRRSYSRHLFKCVLVFRGSVLSYNGFTRMAAETFIFYPSYLFS